VNDSFWQAPARASAVHRVIADMWPDDHDAMLSDMECRTHPTTKAHPGDDPPRSVTVRMDESPSFSLVTTTIADMWPDDDEEMRAIGAINTAGDSTGMTSR